MNFNLYFAGSQNKLAMNLIAELGCNKLCSQFSERNDIHRWVQYFKDHPECKSKLMVDSGAWTAYTRNVTIDIDDYINFINTTGDYVEVFVELDKIPGTFGSNNITPSQIEEAAKITWSNYLYMVSKVDKKYRDKIIPVFHYEEDFKYLDNILNYTFEDGHSIQYMGLGGIADLSDVKGRSMWLERCFDTINKSKNPNIKVHVFGMTSLNIIPNFPIYSVDSTTWIMNCIHGNIIYKGRSIYVGNQKNQPNSIYNQTSEVQKDIENKIISYGFTMEDLSNNYIARSIFNIHSLKDWQDSYTYKPSSSKMQKFILF